MDFALMVVKGNCGGKGHRRPATRLSVDVQDDKKDNGISELMDRKIKAFQLRQ
jgi:hypothetical protein